MKHEYPKWIYSITGASKLVQNSGQHTAAGSDWYESPAVAALAVSAAEAPAPPAPVAAVPAAPVADIDQPMPVAVEMAVTDDAPTEVDSEQDKLDRFYASSAKVIVDHVRTMDTVADLDELRDLEERRPDGARRTVLTAIAARIRTLEGPVTAAPVSQPEEPVHA